MIKLPESYKEDFISLLDIEIDTAEGLISNCVNYPDKDILPSHLLRLTNNAKQYIKFLTHLKKLIEEE